MLGKFIAGDFIAIAGEMRRFTSSNENTDILMSVLDLYKLIGTTLSEHSKIPHCRNIPKYHTVGT